MSIEVSTWNIAKGLGDDNQGLIFEGIKKLGSEVIVMSEAFKTTLGSPNEQLLQFDYVLGAVENFAFDNGYKQVISYPYVDYPKPLEALDDEVYGLVLSRTALTITVK